MWKEPTHPPRAGVAQVPHLLHRQTEVFARDSGDSPLQPALQPRAPAQAATGQAGAGMRMEGGPLATSHGHQHARRQQHHKRVTRTVSFNTDDTRRDGELLSPMHTWATEARTGGDPQSHWQMAEPCCLPNGGLTYWGTPCFSFSPPCMPSSQPSSDLFPSLFCTRRLPLPAPVPWGGFGERAAPSGSPGPPHHLTSPAPHSRNAARPGLSNSRSKKRAPQHNTFPPRNAGRKGSLLVS